VKIKMGPDKTYPKLDPSQDASSWIWMLSGLSLGLIISTAIYLNHTNKIDEVSSYLPNQRSSGDHLEPAPEVAVVPEANPFTFYATLPKANPQIASETNPLHAVNQTNTENTDPYILQVGAFTISADAERMKTNLALLNIESSIQKATINSNDYHRVIIEPMGEISELNSILEQLRNANIDVFKQTIPD